MYLASWGLLGGPWVPFWTLSGSLGAHFRSICELLGTFLFSWGRRGWPLKRLGRPLGRLGWPLGRPGWLLERLGCHFWCPEATRIGVKINVESNYEFLCIFDHVLNHFGFAQTFKNLEFHWQGTQNRRRRRFQIRCDFRPHFGSEIFYSGIIFE